MPRRSRNRLVWSIDQVCRETSFSREVVVHLMQHGVLPSMLYQGDRCTTPKAVDRLLRELMDGYHQDVCIAGRYPFRSLAPRAPKPTSTATEAALAFIEEAIAQVGGKTRRHIQHAGGRTKSRAKGPTNPVEAS